MKIEITDTNYYSVGNGLQIKTHSTIQEAVAEPFTKCIIIDTKGTNSFIRGDGTPWTAPYRALQIRTESGLSYYESNGWQLHFQAGSEQLWAISTFKAVIVDKKGKRTEGNELLISEKGFKDAFNRLDALTASGYDDYSTADLKIQVSELTKEVHRLSQENERIMQILKQHVIGK